MNGIFSYHNQKTLYRILAYSSLIAEMAYISYKNYIREYFADSEIICGYTCVTVSQPSDENNNADNIIGFD